MSQTTSLLDLIQTAIAKAVQSLHTSMPGRVVSYSASKQTAEVQPHFKLLANLPGRLKALANLPNIPDVPVLWPGGGGAGLHCPLAAGDHVLLVFCERSIDTWRSTGASTPVDPEDQRTHTLSGAVALPLMRKDAGAWTSLGASTMKLGVDADAGKQVNFGATIELGGAAEFIALAQKVLTELNKVKTAFDAHTHTWPGGMAPAPTTAPLVPMPSFTAPAATKVKAS